MSAVERIEAAIQKLDALKSESTPGEWWGTGYQVFAGSGLADDIEVVEGVRLLSEAELIVTLHRTIDAQLAILRHVLTHYRGDLGISTNRHVVALADAILGGAE